MQNKGTSICRFASSPERKGEGAVEAVGAGVSFDGCLETTEKHLAGIHAFSTAWN